MAVEHRVVRTKSGHLAMLCTADGEVMHPGVGPLAEARDLYVVQSRLRDRLASADRRLTVFDVGLGAGSIALAARSIAEAGAPGSASLEIVSFERNLDALVVALEHPEAFGLEGEPGLAARTLIAEGRHTTARTDWRLAYGDVFEQLDRETARADIVYWDMYSPRKHPMFWTVAAFAQIRALAGPACTLFTYSASTASRIALLCAGWAVGLGTSIGEKWQTTAAAVRLEDLEQPLTIDWMRRLRRADVPLPADAPADFLARIEAMPQFHS